MDITVLVRPEDLETFLDAVLERFPPRIRHARAFALEHQVLLVQASRGVPVDVSLGIPGYEEEAWTRAVSVELPGIGRLRIASAVDLIIYKCVAGRSRDIEDVEGILIRQRLQLDLGLVRKWLEAFRPAVETHDPRHAFEQALARAQQALREEA